MEENLSFRLTQYMASNGTVPVPRIILSKQKLECDISGENLV